METLTAKAHGRLGSLEWASDGLTAPGETLTGDLWLAVPRGGGLLAAVVDGLGHGSEAMKAAAAAAAVLTERAEDPLPALFERCNEALRHTRGVVMSLAALEPDGGLTWLGVGNVEGLLVHARDAQAHETLPLRGGIVGGMLPPLRAHTATLSCGDMLVLATDGIRHGLSGSVDLDDEPDRIAARILAEHARGDDDALVLVVRRTDLPGVDGDDAISATYRAALRRHLADPGEQTLTAGYNLGRRALEEGAGIVEIAAAHGAAMPQLAPLSQSERAHATQFLLQALAPFEMASGGYREANRELQSLNAELTTRVERRTAELAAANLELEAFAYSVSHDLRAPLRAVDGFAQLLLDDYTQRLDERGREYLRRCRAATQRMATLIDNLLELSRNSRAELRREQLDLSALAHEVAAGLTARAPERDVEFAIEDGVEAIGDPGLLRVVLENLLGNAWKFTATHDRARIEFGRCEHDGVPACFVRDDGVGFDMESAERIFAPFQRLHAESAFPGSGIGLASARRTVRRHGGDIWAEAEPERGATFTFTLNSSAAD